jgi:hypothetical protein
MGGSEIDKTVCVKIVYRGKKRVGKEAFRWFCNLAIVVNDVPMC